MIIGYDAKRAVFNNTGLGNYSRLVIDVMSEYYRHNHYYLYTPHVKDNNRLTHIIARGNVHLRTPRHALSSALWRSVNGVLKDARHNHVQLFHGLSGELPLKINRHNIRSVVTIHDLIFRRYPEYYNFIDRKIYDYKALKACKNADRVIAISECTKRDIIHYYGTPADKIDVVYQGCDEIFHNDIPPVDIENAKTKYYLPDNYFLFIGRVEDRKNVMLAVKALQKINDKNIKLVIVGHHSKYCSKIKHYTVENAFSDRIIYIPSAHFRHLPVFYHLAKAFIFPSRYEGFGIPVLEAQSCGTPVIAATGSCLEEAGGDAAIYVDPDSVEQMVKAMNDVTAGDGVREKMIARGFENVKRFNRQAMADNLMNIYNKVMER